MKKILLIIAIISTLTVSAKHISPAKNNAGNSSYTSTSITIGT